jgi:hypothetical protein
MQRFDESLPRAIAFLTLDCLHTTACADAGYPILRYEDRFFDNPTTVRAVAQHMGIDVSDSIADRIFRRYHTDAVREFAATVTSLPPERLEGDGKSILYDRITQIHRTHIGDARVGKWRDHFDEGVRTMLTQKFSAFLARFGYPD